MSGLRILTAGESHGPGLSVIIEGLPAGLSIDRQEIDRQLQRRQKGYGRGKRMKLERDEVQVLSGLRFGKTLGSPLTLFIANRDNASHAAAMDAWKAEPGLSSVTVPRPGHADLAGAVKHRYADLRNAAERASARETAARTAAGAVLRQLLAEFGVRIGSHVIRIHDAGAPGFDLQIADSQDRTRGIETLCSRAEDSCVRCADQAAEAAMRKAIDRALEQGDSVGGIFESAAWNVPFGLGGMMHWDRRLDAALGAAFMSIPGVKSVEIGMGAASAACPGSKVHDIIEPDLNRRSNRAGGVEGGVSNGQPIIVRAAMKPIPTLGSPLDSVDLQSGDKTKAPVFRADTCAVPAAAVVGEAMMAVVLTRAFIDAFGSDSLEAMKEGYDARKQWIEKLLSAGSHGVRKDHGGPKGRPNDEPDLHRYR
ncbi:MAG TPA: chorismate synthase [bacterium]|nr:chorismate synthase [bacterium]